MTVNCSICLLIFKEPVCLPCGHIYCSKCLFDHINAIPNKGMTASCPECRTNFNIFTPELACLPKQYHQFILPSMRRVYLDLSASSALQKKLDQAEARLKVHKNHEESLTKQCESLSAALDAHRLGESKALQDVKVLKKKMVACNETRQLEIDNHSTRYQELDEKYEALQDDYMEMEMRCQILEKQLEKQWNEQLLAHLQAKPEEKAECSGSKIPPPKTSVTESRAVKSLPKRRATRRTRSNSPPPIYDSLVKRPRLSGVTDLFGS